MSEEVSVLKSIPKQFAALMETEVRPPISEMAAVLNGAKQERRSLRVEHVLRAIGLGSRIV